MKPTVRKVVLEGIPLWEYRHKFCVGMKSTRAFLMTNRHALGFAMDHARWHRQEHGKDYTW